MPWVSSNAALSPGLRGAHSGEMMRSLRFAGLILIGLTLSACLPVTTKTPLGTTAQPSRDAALIGTWYGGTPDGKSPGYFHFLPSKDGNEITVVMASARPDDNKDWMVFTATGVELGGRHYLNARATFENGEVSRGSKTFPVLYSLKNKRLTVFLLDEKATAEAIRAGRIAGTVEDGQFGNVELTADANALDNFFASKEGAALFSEKMFVLQKAR